MSTQVRLSWPRVGSRGCRSIFVRSLAMHARFKKGAVIAFILTVVAVAGSVNWSRSPIEYHQRALAAEEIAAVKEGKGRLPITDRIRQWLGRPPVDHLTAVAQHQQALVDAGFLARRDLMLAHDFDLSLFSPSNMPSVGGEFS